jgi:predicted ester cyclase
MGSREDRPRADFQRSAGQRGRTNVSEHNKAIIRRIREEVVGAEHFGALGGLYADNYRYHGGTFGELEGPDAFKNLLQGMSSVLDGYHERVLDQVAEGNRVASRITGKGRVVGELLGVNGGGKTMENDAIVISAFNSAGQIEEEWVVADTLAMLEQISG